MVMKRKASDTETDAPASMPVVARTPIITPPVLPEWKVRARALIEKAEGGLVAGKKMDLGELRKLKADILAL
jgi:hypothetical protein